jgi:hypothetical protein
MRRDLDMTLPANPAGGHIAFGIMLATKSVDYKKEEDRGIVIYRLKGVPYEMVDHIADDAMTVFSVPGVDFLDVGAGLHFNIKRRYTMRRTGDDR